MPRDAPHWANRIHVDDAATAIVQLLQLPDPRPLYLGVDDTPLPLHVLYDHLASLVGARRCPRRALGRRHGKQAAQQCTVEGQRLGAAVAGCAGRLWPRCCARTLENRSKATERGALPTSVLVQTSGALRRGQAGHVAVVVVLHSGVGQGRQGGQRVPAQPLEMRQEAAHRGGVHRQWRMPREQSLFLFATPAAHDIPARRLQHDQRIELAP